MRPKQEKQSSEMANLTSLLLPEECIAKTRTTDESKILLGRNVLEHCQIVGSVAQHILAQMSKHCHSLFPQYAEKVALVHDVGKACPTFQKKIYKAANIDCSKISALRNASPEQEKQWGGHATVSQSTLSGCQVAKYVAEIAGQHHGRNHAKKPYNYSAFGGEAWHNLRRILLCKLLNKSSESDFLWPHIKNWEQAQLISGLTIVSDWIGSGQCFDDPEEDWQPLVDNAVKNAGFTPLSIYHNLSFEDIFSFSPLETQQKFYDHVNSPGVYILEAPMGIGKTEAALFAAYKMLDKGLSSGIYFALPTQLTSNRIYTRFNAFLAKIVSNLTPAQAHLLHGKAWLAPYISQEMGKNAAPHGSWFSGKKGILAPFAVGTIDQALMAVMRVRHNAVRAFGLAGKTVILDEVHSYDGYTGTILDALVQLLRNYGCTVIILSATLTAERRAAFTHAYSTNMAYPLISISKNTVSCVEASSTAPKTHQVKLHHCHDDPLAIEEALLRAEQGQQVLWIENTVKQAQEAFKILAARASSMDIDIGLIHSRFTAKDRALHEERWTGLYGKNVTERYLCGRILIGTQVLEQSIDIDADFLITRFCPTDMLLQRLGRLWRHQQSRPKEAECMAWLLHPSLSEVEGEPRKIWGAVAKVYAPYVLYRSLLQWNNLTKINLPIDIRNILEATYAVQDENNILIQQLFNDLNVEKERLESLAMRGLSIDGVTLKDEEENAQTRAGQKNEVDVLLLRFFNKKEKKVVLADGTELDLQVPEKHNWQSKQYIASQLTLNIVRVTEVNAPAAIPLPDLAWLSPWLYCGNKDYSLRVAIIAANDYLQNIHGLAESKKIVYRKDYGYMTF